MTCPMCEIEAETERVQVGEAVFVFCCERCRSTVLQAWAEHQPSDPKAPSAA